MCIISVLHNHSLVLVSYSTTYLSIKQSINNRSINLPINYQSIHQLNCLPNQSINLSTQLSFSLPVYLFIHLPIHSFIHIYISSLIISFSLSSTLSLFPTSFPLCETRSPFPVCSCPMNCGPLHVQIASRQSAQSHCHMTLPARRIVYWILDIGLHTEGRKSKYLLQT